MYVLSYHICTYVVIKINQIVYIVVGFMFLFITKIFVFKYVSVAKKNFIT